METLLGITLGIGLSAACGFRIFVPFLFMSIAAQSGHLSLAQEFQWIGSEYAMITFATATFLEVTAYYVPWLDNLLDSVATPAAIVAGTVATASVVGDVSPFVKWTLAVIGGGGAAAVVQGGTVLVRGTSSTLTGGTGNFVVSTGELAGSALTSIVAVLMPVVGLMAVGVACVVVVPRLMDRDSPPDFSEDTPGRPVEV